MRVSKIILSTFFKYEKNPVILGYRVMLALVPSQKVRLGQMMEDLGLDPNDMTQNDLTPIGIGNKVGTFIGIDTQSDGMNQLGDQNGAKYTKIPFKDYTGYQPINTPYRVHSNLHLVF